MDIILKKWKIKYKNKLFAKDLYKEIEEKEVIKETFRRMSYENRLILLLIFGHIKIPEKYKRLSTAIFDLDEINEQRIKEAKEEFKEIYCRLSIGVIDFYDGFHNVG